MTRYAKPSGQESAAQARAKITRKAIAKAFADALFIMLRYETVYTPCTGITAVTIQDRRAPQTERVELVDQFERYAFACRGSTRETRDDVNRNTIMAICMLFRIVVFTVAVSLLSATGLSREWIDNTGRFRVEAEYVSHSDNSVQIRRQNGAVVAVPIRRLSAIDRTYVQSQRQHVGVANVADESKPKSAKLLLERLVRYTNKENYLAVRSALMNADDYNPYSTDIVELHHLFAKQRYEEILQAISGNKNLWLSPRAHFLAYKAAQMTGQAARAKREERLWNACLEGIKSTGDGSQARPFVVTRISDEYDVINRLSSTSIQQKLMVVDGRHFDALTVDGGQTVWFDISDVYGRGDLPLKAVNGNVRFDEQSPDAIRLKRPSSP